MMELQAKALQIHNKLLEAYGEPLWRNPLPPVDELVSTILSQNTNDVNRDRAFDSLRAEFPTWEQVRDADTEAVIAAVRVAGLANQKGPRIQQVLRDITTERGSLDLSFLEDMPLEEARAWLTKFKGVGPKTAAIVLCFSLNRPAFPVDTHIYRVTGRIGLRPEKMTVEQAHPHLESLFPPETFYAAHLNIIRLGREICGARKPDCPVCPVRDLCDYEPKTKSPPVSLELEKLGIPHRIFRHACKVTSLEQAARERGQSPQQIVRSILFRIGEDEYLMALVAGPAQVSWKALRGYLGQSRLTMADEDEVLAVTGYPIGAVSPFGTVRQLRLLVDPGVFAEEEISIGSGIRGTTIILKSDDLKRALGEVEMVTLLEKPS